MTFAAHRRRLAIGLSCLVLALAAACRQGPPTAPEGGCATPDNLLQVSGGEDCFATVTALAKSPASETLLVHVDGNHRGEMWADLSSADASRRYIGWFYLTNPLDIPWDHVTKVAFVQPEDATPEWGRDMGSSCRSYGFCRRDENAEALADAIRKLKMRHGAERLIYVGYSGGAIMGGLLAGMASDIGFDEMIFVIEPYGAWQYVEAEVIKLLGRQYSVLGYIPRIPKTTRITVILGAGGWYRVDPADEIDYYRQLKAAGLDVTLHDLRGRTDSQSRALSSPAVKEALTDAIVRTAP